MTGLPTPLPKFRVHDSYRWADDGPDGENFISLFRTDQSRLSCLRFTRNSRAQFRTDGTKKRVHHGVLCELQLALQDDAGSELSHQDLVDLVLDNLRDGDHTLGGVAITHSDPEAPIIQDGMFANVLCHVAEIRFTVEELVS